MIFIAMLRGINVSGKNHLAMPDLTRMVAGLGLDNVQTYVQSGNVIFAAPDQEMTALALRIQSQIKQAFSLDVPVVMRSGPEMQRIHDNNPFLTTRNENPDFLHVTFLAAPTSPARVQGLSIQNAGADKYVIRDREIYLYCPGGYGRTKLTNTVFEKKLGVQATTRNWKTVTALAELAAAR